MYNNFQVLKPAIHDNEPVRWRTKLAMLEHFRKKPFFLNPNLRPTVPQSEHTPFREFEGTLTV